MTRSRHEMIFVVDLYGSLAGAGGSALDFNDDGSIIIAIIDAEILYEMQLESFIEDYGLQSQFTPEELMEYIGEECAVSNVGDVFDCLKCHFIGPLGLSDEDNWDLMEDFDIVADCIGDPNSSCVDCGISLEEFKNEHDLELTVEEEAAILAGVNSINCGTDEFEEEAWNELAFYFSQNIDLTEGAYSTPENVGGLCWNSLNLAKIANGYYVKIANFSVKFHHAQSNTWIDISFPSLCLQSSGNDFFTGESMSNSDIKKSFANAIEAARLGIFTQLNRGVVH